MRALPKGIVRRSNAMRSSLTIGAVALVLGLLVVVQLRSQAQTGGLETLSAQELTVLVANLNTRNDQLRAEIASLDQELRTLVASESRGETSLGQLQLDLARVRGWAGLAPVSGPGVRITVTGPLPGSAVEDLVNELRNAGAEAIGVADVRMVPGEVVAGQAGDVSIENMLLDDPFEVRAIGNAETLTGTLTRAGGIVAQLAATFPDAQLTVTPVSNVQLPATSRDLEPVNGRRKL